MPASGLLGLAAAFAAIGFGDLPGIDESETGPLAAAPVALSRFGILSLPPALLILGFGAHRARVLPTWGVGALAFVALMLPATLLITGAVQNDQKNTIPGVMLSVAGVGWVVVGYSIRRGASLLTPSHGSTRVRLR